MGLNATPFLAKGAGLQAAQAGFLAFGLPGDSSEPQRTGEN